MGLSLHPERLRRYKDGARLFYKYGQSDLARRAGLDEAIADETFAERADDGKPEEQVAVKVQRPNIREALVLTSDRPAHKR